MISWREEGNPRTALEEHLFDLLHEIEYRIADALDDELTNLKSFHPRDIIIMLCSNIIVHLLSRSLSNHSFISERINLVEDCTEEIKGSTMKLWTALEASKVDNINPH